MNEEKKLESNEFELELFDNKTEFLRFCKYNKIQGDAEVLWTTISLQKKIRLFWYE